MALLQHGLLKMMVVPDDVLGATVAHTKPNRCHVKVRVDALVI